MRCVLLWFYQMPFVKRPAIVLVLCFRQVQKFVKNITVPYNNVSPLDSTLLLGIGISNISSDLVFWVRGTLNQKLKDPYRNQQINQSIYFILILSLTKLVFILNYQFKIIKFKISTLLQDYHRSSLHCLCPTYSSSCATFPSSEAKMVL